MEKKTQKMMPRYMINNQINSDNRTKESMSESNIEQNAFKSGD